MAPSADLSANARKQQQEDVERLVKCRVRSETEARKAAESGRNRAMHEARELKKELVLLRQEKEELRLRVEAHKRAVSVPAVSSGRNKAGGGGGKASSSSDSGADSNKAQLQVHKLQQQTQQLSVDKSQLQRRVEKLEQELSESQQREAEAGSQAETELAEAQRGLSALREELAAAQQAVDDTKRKCQRLLRDKKEETQRALRENEQLARCAKTLEGQLALLPQLKRQLERARDKRTDAAEAWQLKLQQREQAFLREDEASRRALHESEEQVARLEREKQQLEQQLGDVESHCHTQRQQETQRRQELTASVASLREELRVAQAATVEAQSRQRVAEETQTQETRLRQLAEDAADAVEQRAQRAEQQLEDARAQLQRLEAALETRGITSDYLLKRQTSVRGSNDGSDGRTTVSASRTTSSKANARTKPSACSGARDPVRSKTVATVANPRVAALASGSKIPRRSATLRSNNDDERERASGSSERSRSR